MGQLEDFRASLKRKDSAESSEGEIPVKSIAKEKQEKMKRRTLGVSGELHIELKALSVWRIKNHPKASPVLHFLEVTRCVFSFASSNARSASTTILRPT